MDSYLMHIYMTKIRTCCRSYLNDELKSYNLTSSEGKYLGLLGDKGAMSQNEMSNILGYDKAYTSRIITSLLAKGYIREMVSSDDGRKKIFEISEKGEELGKIVHYKMNEFIDKYLCAGIAQKDKEEAINILKVMSQNGKKYFEGEHK